MPLRLNARESAEVLKLLGREPVASLNVDVVWELVHRGAVRLVVTSGGLSAVAEDGLVPIDDERHVQDCERVRLAARGARRRGDCTCGSSPS